MPLRGADAPVSKPALLRQTLELGSLYSGRELSLTKMVGSLQDAGNTTTLSGYLGLLDASGLLAGLHKCSNDAARRRASVPKMQVHNSALRNYAGARTLASATADPEEWGRCVESAVGAHLLSQSFAKGFDVLYWRDGGLEVDYVLRRGGVRRVCPQEFLKKKLQMITIDRNINANTRRVRDTPLPLCGIPPSRRGVYVGH